MLSFTELFNTVASPIINFGVLMCVVLIVFIIYKWGNLRLVGTTPANLFVFISILFTSGLDVGLIMFPLTEFGGYKDAPYDFTNPLAIEFGFWGFWIWTFYFITAFYFCAIEPKVKFFEIPWVKWVNNIVIIGTCAFTGALFLNNLPWYVPSIGDGTSVVPGFYFVVLLVIFCSAYSSTEIHYLKILAVASTYLFAALIIYMFIYSGLGFTGLGKNLTLIGDYFVKLPKFILPMTEYHEFYLFWWFAWSIMIGQFTSRFVGNMKTWHLLLALLIIPSIPIAIWFSVLYHVHVNNIPTTGFVNYAMIAVGTIFVINSLDSLIRLYTYNLGFTVEKYGRVAYILGNVILLSGLVLAFKSQWIQIHWIGALVIGLFMICIGTIAFKHREKVLAIK